MKRGMTLVEVLVVAGLLSLILTVAVMVFGPAVRSFRRGQDRAESQQTVAVAARWLKVDIQSAAPGSVRWDTDQLVMVTQGDPPAFEADGEPQWTTILSYWKDGQGELHRQSDPLGAADPEAAAPSAHNPAARVVARNLSQFECSTASAVVKVTLEAKKDDHRCRLETSFSSALAPMEPPPP
ncbi:MAG: type II secretion system protein [Candidatus Eremiobacteraeota bacterium]|nr:type II secretion system protein [Candidatus Eremiobacteraeota bacterium]